MKTKLLSKNIQKTIVFISVVFFITGLANATIPCDPPTGYPTLSAEVINSSRVKLSWNDVLDEDGYYIYRKESGDPSYGDPIGTVYEDVTSYIDDEGLEPLTDYDYYVAAYNECDENDSDPVLVTTSRSPIVIFVDDDANGNDDGTDLVPGIVQTADFILEVEEERSNPASANQRDNGGHTDVDVPPIERECQKGGDDLGYNPVDDNLPASSSCSSHCLQRSFIHCLYLLRIQLSQGSNV